ncbi:low molecular weight protein-tyrosine-phosphatase [Arcobacter roscoffensis]|uniref:protein-tyrosine-phosphatase n=1 Tax=Arcobacter roscoffensis TaxID=2961520 RepID=A0ABY5E475_9BACT|nr:low molecular weight protein-tyrosine-phosphatase [Arcobacter roscoffensis]UTJ06540.1 low molecular weight phosphotyrosine protein phosphatase [Arcobacter roscoffensis]
MSKVKSIIFVCLGNICRSPIAQGVGQRYAKQNNLDLDVQSAGTGDWHIGEPPCENSIKVCKQNDLDISKQRAQQVTIEDLKNYDLVVGLDDSNITNLKKLGAKDVLKLGDFGFDGQDVPDPYFFEGFEGFDKVYEMIEICVENLIKEKC